MAYTSLLRDKKFALKKTTCYAALEINEGTESGDIAAASANYKVCNLPPDAIINDAYVHVKTGSDAATSNVATLGTTEGGSEILSAGDLKTAGDSGTFTGQSLTGSGVAVYLGTTVTGAATAVGEYIVVVEYMEYTKNNGEYTSVTD